MISIIDDDDIVRAATADLINALGYEIRTFASAEQFLQSGDIEDTFCIVTDLQMPGLNGLELQSRLIAAGYQKPFIFITAFPTKSARDRAMRSGAVAFLSKPFEEESLIESLRRAALTAQLIHQAG